MYNKKASLKLSPSLLRELAISILIAAPVGLLSSNVEGIANPNSTMQSRFITGVGGAAGSRLGYLLGSVSKLPLKQRLMLSLATGSTGAIGGHIGATKIREYYNRDRVLSRPSIIDDIKNILKIK